MYQFAIIILLLVSQLSGLARGQDTFKVPEMVTGTVDTFIKIEGDSPSKSIGWFPLTSGIAVFPSSELKNPKSTFVISKTQGKYEILASACDTEGNIVSQKVVVFVINPSPNPEPNPNPNPNPNPTPEPTGLVAKLTTAFGHDDSKLEKKKFLSQVYQTIAKGIKSPDFPLTEVGELKKGIESTYNIILGKGSLPTVKKVIDNHLMVIYDSPPERKLDSQLLTEASVRLEEIVKALDQIK